MKILLVHNRYQQIGGEDSVFQADVELIKDAGHQVILYERDNAEIKGYSATQRITLFKNTTWSTESQKDVYQILRKEQPQVVHFHNTFPLISPSAYYACKEAGVGVVQTLHNYRLLCPNSMFFRDGRICEDCLGKLPPWPGVLHACYRGSRVQTAAVATMIASHHLLKTWHDQVHVFIALSHFAREKFIQGGLPADKITVRPNFIYPDPGPKEEEGTFALFVGRLSREKGVSTLLKAWQRLEDIRLNIVGDGPLYGEVQRFVTENKMRHVKVIGHLDRQSIQALYKQARFLIVPSECYENFPMVIVEAFACGLPVITTRLGAMQEIVKNEITGLHFDLSSAEDLAVKIAWLWSRPEESYRMGLEARKEYEMKYTAQSSYQKLQEIYELAIERH